MCLPTPPSSYLSCVTLNISKILVCMVCVSLHLIFFSGVQMNLLYLFIFLSSKKCSLNFLVNLNMLLTLMYIIDLIMHVSVYMYIHIYIHTYAHMCETYILLCIHGCMYTYIYIYIFHINKKITSAFRTIKKSTWKRENCISNK